MYRFTIGLIFLLCTSVAFAQFDNTTNELDSITYAQYTQKDWHGLLTTANKLTQQHQGFYLLYVRAALAANALNKTFTEQYYLQKANHLFPNDPYVLPMLYMNYLNIGQYPQALRTNKQIQTFEIIKPYYPKAPPINMVNAEYGIKVCTDSSLYKPLHYTQAGIGFRIGTVSVYNALSYLSQAAYYGNMQQYQYYLTALIPLKNNWTLAPAFHILHYDVTNNPPYLDTAKLSGNPYVYGLSASKIYKNWQYSLAAYVSDLNYEHQLQIQPGLTWYPLSNNRLSLATTLNYLTEKKELAASYMLSFMPAKKLSLSLAYLQANTRYYTEQNGFLVNNSYDVTRDRTMLMANWNMVTNWTIYTVLLHESKIETGSDKPYAFDMGVIGLRKTF